MNLNSGFTSGPGAGSMLQRVAQVVFTPTRLPGVSRDQILVEGEAPTTALRSGFSPQGPVQRSTFGSVMPAILLESPAPGEALAGAVRLEGPADAFEAQFVAELHDDAGRLIFREPVTSTSGTGIRGRFDLAVSFRGVPSGPGTPTAYDLSAKDGSRIDAVSIPVTLSA